MINGTKLIVLLINQKDYGHSTLKLILVWWFSHLDSILGPPNLIPAKVVGWRLAPTNSKS